MFSSSLSSSLTASSASMSYRVSSRNPYHQFSHQICNALTIKSAAIHPTYSIPRVRHHIFVTLLAPSLPRSNGYFLPQQPARPSGSNSRGLNVRWDEIDNAVNAGRHPLTDQYRRPVSIAAKPRRRSDELNGSTRRARSGREERSTSLLGGDGGKGTQPRNRIGMKHGGTEPSERIDSCTLALIIPR